MVEKKEGTRTRSTVMNHGPSELVKKHMDQSEKLVLDHSSVRPSKTRTELYKELSSGQKGEDKDHYEYSPIPLRGVAFIIDILFIFILVNVLLMLPAFEVKVVNIFLAKYKLQFMFGDKILSYALAGVTIFFGLFFFVIIPTAFFNTSVGKKITGQRVRGDYKYTLSISQAFQRELIWKPLGIALLVGIFMPLIDKKRKSLHDKITGTIVVRD